MFWGGGGGGGVDVPIFPSVQQVNRRPEPVCNMRQVKNRAARSSDIYPSDYSIIVAVLAFDQPMVIGS